MPRTFIPFLALLVVLGGTTGCQHVKPWQRGGLADSIMISDRDPLGAAENEHIFFLREAAAGGGAVGGGGCGCN
jgi:hypothetical protein